MKQTLHTFRRPELSHTPEPSPTSHTPTTPEPSHTPETAASCSNEACSNEARWVRESSPKETETEAEAEAEAVVPLRRQRDYRRLWSARTISLTGSEVSRLAVPLTAATLLGASPAQMGILAASASLPALLLGLHSGAIADRLPRHRPLMIACELVSAAAAFSVPITWALGVLSMPWLIATALIIGSCAVVFRAANFPYLATIVPPEQQTEAMAGNQASYSTATIVGPGAAGLLVQILTAPFAVLAEGVSFLTSALLLRSIRTPDHHTPNASRGMSRDIVHGLRTSVTHPILRAVLGAGVTINFFGAASMAIYVLFMIQGLHIPQGLLGLLTAVMGIGGVLSAAVTPRLARRFGESRLMLWAILLFPVDLIALVLVHGPLALIVTVLVITGLIIGGAVVAFATCMGTIVMRESPADARGRVNATMTFAIQGVMTIGGLFGGFLAEFLGLRPVLWICAAGFVLTPLWLWTSPLRSRRVVTTRPDAAPLEAAE